MSTFTDPFTGPVETTPVYTSMVRGKPLLAQQLDELSRKINTLVITVQLQNKKIEEIRRACINDEVSVKNQKAAVISELSHLSLSKASSASTSLQSLPSSFPVDYIVNAKTKDAVRKNKRLNTYESFDKIDELPTMNTNRNARPITDECKEYGKVTWSRRFMSCM